MRLALGIALLAGCGSDGHQIAIGAPPGKTVEAVLTGPLCSGDHCKCRTGAEDAGFPADNTKRFEIRLKSAQQLWATVRGNKLYKNAEQPEACFYVDLAQGASPVELRASGSAGAACTSARDCKLVPQDSDCMYACTSGICQLRGTTKTEGTGPCYGEILAQAVMRLDVNPAPPVYLLCDAYADLYCNRTTHVCDAVKKRGAACTTQSECGIGGTSVGGKCETAPGVGHACEPGVTSCGREGFCDPKERRCEPRRDNGQPCDNLGEQCKSAFCGFGDAAHHQVCMPAPTQRHCPEVP